MLWMGTQSRCGKGMREGDKRYGNQALSPSLGSAPLKLKMTTRHSQDHSNIQAKQPVGDRCSYQENAWAVERGHLSLN